MTCSNCGANKIYTEFEIPVSIDTYDYRGNHVQYYREGDYICPDCDIYIGSDDE